MGWSTLVWDLSLAHIWLGASLGVAIFVLAWRQLVEQTSPGPKPLGLVTLCEGRNPTVEFVVGEA